MDDKTLMVKEAFRIPKWSLPMEKEENKTLQIYYWH